MPEIPTGIVKFTPSITCPPVGSIALTGTFLDPVEVAQFRHSKLAEAVGIPPTAPSDE
jgi:hypothetical protein